MSGVKVLDLEDSDSTLAGFAGGVTDGTFGYAVPTHPSHSNGRLVRFPIQSRSTGHRYVLHLLLRAACLQCEEAHLS